MILEIALTIVLITVLVGIHGTAATVTIPTALANTMIPTAPAIITIIIAIIATTTADITMTAVIPVTTIINHALVIIVIAQTEQTAQTAQTSQTAIIVIGMMKIVGPSIATTDTIVNMTMETTMIETMKTAVTIHTKFLKNAQMIIAGKVNANNKNAMTAVPVVAVRNSTLKTSSALRTTEARSLSSIR